MLRPRNRSEQRRPVLRVRARRAAQSRTVPVPWPEHLSGADIGELLVTGGHEYDCSVFKRDTSKTLEVDRLRQLIALGPALVAELDLDTLFSRLLETALSITGARYAALGILDKERRELERFVNRGFSEDQIRTIGELPRGRGVLGVLIQDPRPLRLTEVTGHPKSSGFPPGHPAMHSFLGVPIVIRGRAWGNLYLTDKRTGEFTEDDEYAATTLAMWAAIAVDHARLLAGAAERQA